MKRVFDFVSNLSSDFTELFGYPTIKVYSDFVEVYFGTACKLTNIAWLTSVYCDSYSLFAQDGVIMIVFTFNLDVD